MELLQITDMSAGYDSKTVLSGVNLTVNSQDFIGVIGPNGGGKTTFIKALLGIIKPISGTIDFIDKSLIIGYLPQSKTIDKSFPISVIDTILSGLMHQKGIMGRYTKADRAKAADLMRTCGVEHLSANHIGALSGGQLQRVLLCRALMSDPSLLVLDEPTTYIDNQFEKELYALLKRLNERIAIIMVSHDLGTICSHVKSIACVNGSFHYHPSNVITKHHLELYDCPIQLVNHGNVPHTILHKH